MAIKFGTVVARNNGGDGMYIAGNADVEVERGKFIDNGRHGLYIDSEVAPLRELANKIVREAAQDPSLASQAPALEIELATIIEAAKTPTATKAGIKAMFVTMKDKLVENAGVLAGHAIITLLGQASTIIDSIHHLPNLIK